MLCMHVSHTASMRLARVGLPVFTTQNNDFAWPLTLGDGRLT